MPKDYNVLDEQTKEAERLGMKLEPLEHEDDSKPEEKPEEQPDKKIEEENPEDKKTEDDSEDDETGKKLVNKNPPKGSLQQEAFKQREAKRLESIVDARLTNALSPVMELLNELKQAKTPEAKTEAAENIDDELAKIAEAEKIPVEQFKKIAGLITKQVQSTLAPQFEKVKEFEPMIERHREEEQQRQIQEIFNKEWTEQAEPIIAEQYPNATAKQSKEARTLLAELAVSPSYGDTRGNKEGLPEHPAYPVDYIIYKEAAKFDTILNSPRKKSFESSGTITDDLEDTGKTLEELSDKEITSTADAIKLSKQLDKAYGKEKTVVMRNGEAVDVTE